MIIAAGLLLLGHFLGLTVVCLLAVRYLDRKQADLERRLEDTVRSWVESPAEGEPSQLAKTLDAMGAVVGSAAARSIMASLSAEASHTARAANTASDLITAEQNPILGLLSGGKRGKGAALMKLAEVLGPMLMGRSAGAPASSRSGAGNHGQRSFSL